MLLLLLPGLRSCHEEKEEGSCRDPNEPQSQIQKTKCKADEDKDAKKKEKRGKKEMKRIKRSHERDKRLEKLQRKG